MPNNPNTQTTTSTTKKKDPHLWIIIAFILAFIGSIVSVRVFLFDIFSIPASSMAPTINVGDFVVVNKYIYSSSKTVGSSQPKRGEIIAFRPPHNPDTIFLKRVIGLPGDKLTFSDKTLTINGSPLTTQKIDATTFSENLDGNTYQVKYQNEQNPYRNFSIVVPANSYFVMGDNRDNSVDSRAWGFVPNENLIGKLIMIW